MNEDDNELVTYFSLICEAEDIAEFLRMKIFPAEDIPILLQLLHYLNKEINKHKAKNKEKKIHTKWIEE